MPRTASEVRGRTSAAERLREDARLIGVREQGPRRFFNEEREGIRGSEIKRSLDEQERYGVQMHKLILSPGLQGADLPAYTRETMNALEREKGQNLERYGVIHRNTDHDHVHVVVMGRDKDGGRVRFDRDDYKQLREVGDRYLERVHALDRYMDREVDRLLKYGEREKEPEYKPDRGDREFERLMGGDDTERRRRGEDAARDRWEWEEFDKDLHKTFQKDRGLQAPKGYRQWNLEQSGRLVDFHERYQDQEAKDYWKEVAERNPELADAAMRELAVIEKLELDAGMHRFRDVDIDRLIDGLEPWERELQKDYEREFGDLGRESSELYEHTKMTDEMRESLRDHGLDWLTGR